MRSASFADRHVTSTSSLSVIRTLSCLLRARWSQIYSWESRIAFTLLASQDTIRFYGERSDPFRDIGLARRDGRGLYVWRRAPSVCGDCGARAFAEEIADAD